jgi:hypothetical protein
VPGVAPGASVGVTRTNPKQRTPLHYVGQAAGGKGTPGAKKSASVSAGAGPGGASQQNVKTTRVPIVQLPSVKEIEGTLEGAVADIKALGCDWTGWKFFCD